MRTWRLGISRELPALAVLLLLAACGGGDDSGNAAGGSAAVDHSKGGVASGAVARGGLASGGAAGGGIAAGFDPDGSAGSAAGARGEGTSGTVAPSSLAPHVPNEVIVKFRAGVPEIRKTLARSRASGARLRAFRILEGLEHHRMPPQISVEAAIAAYRQDPDVLYAEPNYIVRATNTPDDARYGELWGLLNSGQLGGTPGADIDAPLAWDITTGSSSVVVAVIDTGIDYNHPDLSANLFRNASECVANGVDDDGNGRIDDCFGVDTVNNDSDPMDDNRHGKHVAGTIGSMGNNAAGVVGINWNVSLMACKFLDAAGSGSTAGAIACLEYLRAMKDRGVNIVATNNSWGGGGFSQALFDAIQRHQEAGILFIAAAGNGNAFGQGVNNDQTPFYPCSYRLANILCVAATTRSDDRAGFSNFGRRTVHIGAPGNEILSTTLNGTYTMLNGTSMATPHVTGTVALLKAADPARDWRAIRNLILAGGDNVPSMAGTITQKRLNAFGALTCSNSPVVARLAPVADSVIGAVGTPIGLSVLNINCAAPNGDAAVTVDPGGQVVTLLDDGLGPDQAAGDGNYSGQWTPAGAGNFTLTFSDGSVVAVSVASLAVDPASVAPGTTVTASWNGIGAPTATDWIGLYLPGAPDTSYLTWRATTGTASGSVPFTIPASVGSGTYQLRLFAKGGFTRLAVSNNLAIGISCPGAGLNANPASLAPGGTLTANWSGVCAPTSGDWIGFFAPGAANSAYVAWRYTTGTASGSAPLTFPATLAPGTYELRLFSNGAYTTLAVASITVGAGCTGAASLGASPASIAAGGSVTGTWSNVCTPATRDWIGIFAPGAANNGYVAWRYTTGTGSGSVPLTVPATLAPGTYELRLFANNGYTRLGTSNAFVVTSP